MGTHRSFLIELEPGADFGDGRVRGRIEHVAWGDREHFGSLDELLAFMSRALRPLDESATGDAWSRRPIA
jgi:hypothetical protein